MKKTTVSSVFNKDFFYDMPIDLCCVIQIDNRKILNANPAFESILGWAPSEVVGNTLDSLTNTTTAKSIIDQAFLKLKSGIRTFTFDIDVRTKNNLERIVEWKCCCNEDNTQVFAIGRDVTSLIETQKTLAHQAQIDQLTGIYNRPTFLTTLSAMLNGASRHHYAASVILADVDNFKAYNVRFGAQKGDEYLKKVSALLRTSLRRKSDFLARYEDDTFALLLTRDDLTKTLRVAEYLRSSLAKHTVPLSFGVAVVAENYQQEMPTDSILSAAKRALSLSQENGGNQVNYAADFGR